MPPNSKRRHFSTQSRTHAESLASLVVKWKWCQQGAAALSTQGSLSGRLGAVMLLRPLPAQGEQHGRNKSVLCLELSRRQGGILHQLADLLSERVAHPEDEEGKTHLACAAGHDRRARCRNGAPDSLGGVPGAAILRDGGLPLGRHGLLDSISLVEVLARGAPATRLQLASGQGMLEIALLLLLQPAHAALPQQRREPRDRPGTPRDVHLEVCVVQLPQGLHLHPGEASPHPGLLLQFELPPAELALLVVQGQDHDEEHLVEGQRAGVGGLVPHCEGLLRGLRDANKPLLALHPAQVELGKVDLLEQIKEMLHGHAAGRTQVGAHGLAHPLAVLLRPEEVRVVLFDVGDRCMCDLEEVEQRRHGNRNLLGRLQSLAALRGPQKAPIPDFVQVFLGRSIQKAGQYPLHLSDTDRPLHPDVRGQLGPDVGQEVQSACRVLHPPLLPGRVQLARLHGRLHLGTGAGPQLDGPGGLHAPQNWHIIVGVGTKARRAAAVRAQVLGGSSAVRLAGCPPAATTVRAEPGAGTPRHRPPHAPGDDRQLGLAVAAPVAPPARRRGR
mmetsp:Transcript_75696/g.235627  ORF Transcript_75696/g.235627 Transcript_75696/m.235627 type:complete len:557 (-) Transcript_75696:213-1883(-)